VVAGNMASFVWNVNCEENVNSKWHWKLPVSFTDAKMPRF